MTNLILAPCGSNGQPLVMVFETRRDSPRLLWFFFTHALGGQKTVDLGAVSLANVHTPNICFLPVLSALLSITDGLATGAVPICQVHNFLMPYFEDASIVS